MKRLKSPIFLFSNLKRVPFDCLLKTIGSGGSSSATGSSTLEPGIDELLFSANNGFHNQEPGSLPNDTSCAFPSNQQCNGYTQQLTNFNPAFADCNGRLPGANPFVIDQSVDNQNFQVSPSYADQSGLLFNAAVDVARPGDIEKADSDSLSWLADDPPPPSPPTFTTSYQQCQPLNEPIQSFSSDPMDTRDPVELAASLSGIVQSQPTVRFIREPADVQFRYLKELIKGNVSPIWADKALKKYPAVEVSVLIHVVQKTCGTFELSGISDKMTFLFFGIVDK